MEALSPGFTLTRDSKTGEDFIEVASVGRALCETPLFNKGTAFSEEERDTLGLRGLLPPKVCSMEEQIHRVMDNYARKNTDLERFIHLAALLDRNETLFYRILLDRIETLMPIVYTPTVGLACQSFSRIYRRGRGLYLTIEDTDRIDTVLANWPNRDVRVIVATDGERILGLGDQGANGMGIPIGKLSLYVAAAGIHPAQTLPVCLDVGTENPALHSDPLYLGRPQHRDRSEAYDRLVETFMEGVGRHFPKAIVQFEDFALRNSFRLLDRYREHALCFNDDIQGTGAAALAVILSALRNSGGALDDQRIVIAGAGSAGVGIARQIRAASSKAQIWMLDSRGILPPAVASEVQKPFARDEKGDLATTCRRVRPTVLIGVTGVAGLFTQEILESMDGPRPIVLPLSNPTSASECTPEDARAWTNGRCQIATGSPFPATAQCNNVYVFPGIGLGLILSGANRATDEHFTIAARTVAGLSGDALLPSLREIRSVSAAVARALGASDPEPAMWEPKYLPYRPAPSLRKSR